MNKSNHFSRDSSSLSFSKFILVGSREHNYTRRYLHHFELKRIKVYELYNTSRFGGDMNKPVSHLYQMDPKDMEVMLRKT